MFALLFFIADVTLSGTDSKFLPIYENNSRSYFVQLLVTDSYIR
jgi:hypothetical protein